MNLVHSPSGATITSGPVWWSCCSIQRVIATSARSTTWSLWTCVTSWAVSLWGGVPASARRITVPRPASNCSATSPHRIRVPGPALPGDGCGIPVPVRTTCSPRLPFGIAQKLEEIL